ncbi:hypothetical protein [Massilia sp. IC2-476]|uniref:hypothetical protein n=1 Tax=Massilia sp. IC2-476 TaxID=2887199 RepID=UPI001D0FF905|nr:hypothetical protein [Massilia sp. IC2-476]MCC2972335.1 hypothetical protein [Massilia sp. IC2-476]
MRPLSFLLPASLLALAAGAAAQNSMPYPPPDTAPGSTVQVSARATPERIKQRQAEKITGNYEMSNGWYLRVRTGARHIDATIDKQGPMRLVRVSTYGFASGDGNVTMDFNRGRDGDDMLMTYVPDPRIAQRVALTSRVAQR